MIRCLDHGDRYMSVTSAENVILISFLLTRVDGTEHLLIVSSARIEDRRLISDGKGSELKPRERY